MSVKINNAMTTAKIFIAKLLDNWFMLEWKTEGSEEKNMCVFFALPTLLSIGSRSAGSWLLLAAHDELLYDPRDRMIVSGFYNKKITPVPSYNMSAATRSSSSFSCLNWNFSRLLGFIPQRVFAPVSD